MTTDYKLDNIRRLLTEGFSEDELRRLSSDAPDFRGVYTSLAKSASLTEVVDHLLDFAGRQMKLEALLAWAEAHNPERYVHHQPYRSGDGDPSPDAESARRAWKIPYGRNPNFTGREELLSELRANLSAGQPATLTQAIKGLGGIFTCTNVIVK